MKKLNLIKKPAVFQGEDYLNNQKNYFEGWYFKNTSKNYNISFIPGISIDKNTKKSFIQIITNENSYNIDYELSDFTFSENPFYIKIKDNYFSFDEIILNINSKAIKIKGKLNYYNTIKIKQNIFNPNIMGPFSYLSFMECNHAIIAMKNNIKGYLSINNKKYRFKDGIGYIEKDWGTSFPKSYIWTQANNFLRKNTSFMLSTAHIPFKVFNFKGLISVLIINGKEYRFATYNGAKIIKEITNDDKVEITLKKGNYILEIITKLNNDYKLIAPVKGQMNKEITESISSTLSLVLKENDKIIYEDTSNDCGLEIVK